MENYICTNKRKHSKMSVMGMTEKGKSFQHTDKGRCDQADGEARLWKKH